MSSSNATLISKNESGLRNRVQVKSDHHQHSQIQSNSSSTSNLNSTHNNNGPSEFVKKLYKMLEDSDSEQIVSWGPAKDSLIVLDQHLFQTHILPRHFKHSNFASFVRQLNKYDFRKVRITPPSSSQNSESGSNSVSSSNHSILRWEFYHPHFRADTLADLDHIKRKTPVARKASTITGHLPVFSNSVDPIPPPLPSLLSVSANSPSSIERLQSDLETLSAAHASTQAQLQALLESHTELTDELKLCRQRLVQHDQRLQKLESPDTDEQASSAVFSTPMTRFHCDPLPEDPLSAGHPPFTSPTSTSSTTNITTTTCNNHSLLQPLPSSTRHFLHPGSHLPPLSTAPASSTCSVDKVQEELPVIGNVFGPPPPPSSPQHTDTQSYMQSFGSDLTFWTNPSTELMTMFRFREKEVRILATSLIRQFNGFTPIISMTADSQPGDLEKYIRIGMNDWLPKPLTKEKLLAILQKHLSQLLDRPMNPNPTYTLIRQPELIVDYTTYPSLFQSSYPSFGQPEHQPPKRRRLMGYQGNPMAS
ncbi:hypothetical protein CROQUDRAFT_94185 [Cronartium quercuum f. sp. fusiforme G11]|uniref:HSF-type DNA-binding domain-containing protein n=1 Tax=Cronartium quercuum f. sp. fusiforme G11 TaxID=708437 RepID=A0A9P6NKH1_9BASI|nr:hypothetical protein CROQUDRAFT_94185 [Cronartium quercuum f. sp. fusiforme G11]